MTVSNRIVAGFAAITLVLVALGAFALVQLAGVRSTVDRIVDRDMLAISQLARVENGSRAMVELRTAAVRRFLLANGAERAGGTNAAEWRRQTDATAAALRTLREEAAAYSGAAVTGMRGEQWRRLDGALAAADTSLARLRQHVEASFTAMAAGDIPTFVAGEDTIARDRSEFLGHLDEARATLVEAVQIGRDAVNDTYTQSQLGVGLALLVAVVLAVGVALAIRRSISVPLNEFMAFVERIGRGELGGATAAAGNDELGRLGGTLNTMVVGLRELAGQSRQATENLNAAANEIRASTQEQAASVEEQLAAVQETAATVDEITQSGGQISRRAQEVIAAAQATARTSDAGIAAVADTVRAMDAIREQAEAVATNIVALSERTQAIGDIITTVNDVSERSHLLALNASIEAAAAGENGRSFAIVAAEMKTLADQAKAATRDVRGILGEVQRGINASVMLTEEAVKRVAVGRERSQTTQGAIEEMLGRIQESIQTFQQIVASTSQQQIGIEQVTLALQNIRQASQQTAASTRQLEQAAGNLTGQSGELLALANRYRL